MRKVIDLECDLPPDENGNPLKFEAATHPPGYGDPERLPPLPGYGFSNYAHIFTRRGDGATGTEAEPEKKSGMSIADFIGMMDRAGVEIVSAAPPLVIARGCHHHHRKVPEPLPGLVQQGQAVRSRRPSRKGSVVGEGPVLCHVPA
jgi:hypothetical protein